MRLNPRKSSWEASLVYQEYIRFFRPSIVEIEGKPSDEQLKEFGITPDSDCVQIRNISGSATGVVLDSNLAEKLWNSGTRPKLIIGLSQVSYQSEFRK